MSRISFTFTRQRLLQQRITSQLNWTSTRPSSSFSSHPSSPNHLSEWIFQCCERYADRPWLKTSSTTYSYARLGHLLWETQRHARRTNRKRKEMGRLCLIQHNDTNKPFSTNEESFLFQLFYTWIENKVACVLPFSASPQILEKCHDMISKYSSQITKDSSDALLLFTSGTSQGQPKGVRLSHVNILSQLDMLRQHVPSTLFDSSDRSCGILPWSHCYGLIGECFSIMDRGGCISPFVYTSSSSSPTLKLLSLWKHIHQTQPTVLFVVPSLLDMWKKLDQETHHLFSKHHYFGSSLRYMVCGGATLSIKTKRYFWDRWGIPIYEGYGCTEMSPMIALQTFFSVENKVFPLLPDVEYQQCPHTLELQVRGPNRFLGYLGEREFSKEQYFPTGDEVTVMDTTTGTQLQITDRLSNVIKLPNGRFFSLTHVDTFLMNKFKSTYTCSWWETSTQSLRAIVSSSTSCPFMETVTMYSMGQTFPIETLHLPLHFFSVEQGTLTLKNQCNRSVLSLMFHKIRTTQRQPT